MRAVAEATRDHCNLSRALAQKARDQIAGSAPNGAIVQSDVGRPARVQDIRDQRHCWHSPLREPVYGSPHGGMLERHEGDAVGLVAGLPEPTCQELWIGALDGVDLAMD